MKGKVFMVEKPVEVTITVPKSTIDASVTTTSELRVRMDALLTPQEIESLDDTIGLLELIQDSAEVK
jgi:hypothetical protein